MIKCEITTLWTSGETITTPCSYDPDSGEIFPEISKGALPQGSLEDEYITLPDGEELQVCMTCHEYVLKTVVGDRNKHIAGGDYGEYQECPNPDCKELA